jgi:uncharacterized protein YcfL
MKKIFLLTIAIAFTLCGCTSHDEGNMNEYNLNQENALIKENAQKVFGNIDAAQDWNSIKQGSVTITADANLDNIEKIQILTESPFGNKDAAILNEAKVEKGQKVTLVYDAPNVYDKLFAACVSSDGKYFVKVFGLDEKEVSFNNAAAARFTRGVGDIEDIEDIEGYPSASSIKLGEPIESFNAQRARLSNAAEDHKIQITDDVNGGNNSFYRNYDVWYNSSWENERMFSITSTPDNDWTFENGTIYKPVTDDVDMTTVKEIVNGFLSKTGAIHQTNGRSNNWETIVTSTPYFVLNKNYLIASGGPITITPIQMNTTEGVYNSVYYYYFNPEVTKNMTEEEEVNYIKALPKYKAINGFYDKEFERKKQYLLPYYGDGVPAAGATAVSVCIPEGYKIGFLNRKSLNPKWPNYMTQNREPYNYCSNGCTYGDGRLNTEINHLKGHYFSAIDKGISQTSEKILTNGNIQTQTIYGLTENGMKWNSPRVAIFSANDHAYMCFEDGADCTFGDMIIEITLGAKVENEVMTLFGEKYTMCFEDRLENADYDMNDVVLQAVRLNETKVQLSLIASGAYDELWIKGLDGSILASKEVHQLFGYDKAEVFINTTKGGEYKDPIVEEFDIAKTQSISDFLKGITIKNESTDKTIAIPTKAGEPPYAIIVPVDFKYPIEKTSITEAYPDFIIWAKDATRPGNWYLKGVQGLIYEK